jgi:glycolate oxidase iron-sulfur subunit
MHIELHPRFAEGEQGQKAKVLTSACVHCGFCLETCPTYVDSRDERDSPRGRIYLIKQLLETGEASAQTRLHLDRCLTCRNCETTCPSGMEYGKLLDIGRELIEQEAPRPAGEKFVRNAIRYLFARPTLLKTGLALGRLLRPLLPKSLQNKVPPAQKSGAIPIRQHARTMVLLEGCVQSAATPLTNGAARRVLDKLGITLISAPAATCCGALDHHLSATDIALAKMRANIDAWWPTIKDGAEAVISSASGCGAQLADYGHLLAHDEQYAEKAERISKMSRDIAQVISAEDLSALTINTQVGKISIHSPCTLQHALGEPHLLNSLLTRAGFNVVPLTGTQLCCGSAGTYSLLQSDISGRLRDQALTRLNQHQPDLIVTANIGCQLQLQSADTPVRHWIELLDQQ